MATVNGFTAERMLEIENTTVIGGTVDANGDLILSQRDGTTIDAGHVVGPIGPTPPEVKPSMRLIGNGVAANLSSGGWVRSASCVSSDDDAWVQGGMTNSSGCIRVPSAGLYAVEATFPFPDNNVGRRGVSIDVNASITAAYADKRANLVPAPTGAAYVCHAITVMCKANDYIRLWVYQNSGSTLALTNDRSFLSFQATKISDLGT